MGRRAEGLQALRQCGALVLEMDPADPHLWTQLARCAVDFLDTPADLRSLHLPLLTQLTEHRELAWDMDLAEVFLALQARVAARVWSLLPGLPAEEGELLDQAVSALAATLQSPDLARFLEAQGAEDGSMAELARLKREVIAAEQLLQSLRGPSSGGSGSGLRDLHRGPGSTDAGVIAEQAEKVQQLRESFRDERQRLIDTDPRFASAFELPSVQALRAQIRHAQAGAALFLLQLPVEGEDPATVGVVLFADGRPSQRLELPELHELAWLAGFHVPECRLGPARGPLRGDPSASSDLVHSAPLVSDELRAQMRRGFWQPLQRALEQAAVPIERLHVCAHGLTQQLPLALREDAVDCPGLQLLAWPGLPYLRLVAATTAPEPSKPWLVGHDCAWGTGSPLPMVAVEAALLRQLLHEKDQAVHSIDSAAQLSGQAAGFIGCCHGGREQAQFDSALHLGPVPLTVSQIVSDRLGPPLALLPACHAGETVDDHAGNALGVAAGFLLGGSRVVAASSKAVPDMLMPWLSTLVLWHVLHGADGHGMAAQEAAQLARQQFGSMHFPEDYRAWLLRALPAALATLQPGGAEDHQSGAAARNMDTALDKLVRCWPWQGEAEGLFSRNQATRQDATASVAAGVLLPRADNAAALAESLREMAAFVFIYGVG